MQTVYGIIRADTQRIYIGRTSRPADDTWRHRRNLLDRGRHENAALQIDWLSLGGAAAFLFQPLVALPDLPVGVGREPGQAFDHAGPLPAWCVQHALIDGYQRRWGAEAVYNRSRDGYHLTPVPAAVQERIAPQVTRLLDGVGRIREDFGAPALR